jgi:hypothetical protein
LLLYSSKPSLGVYQLAGQLLQANKFSGTIINSAPSEVFETLNWQPKLVSVAQYDIEMDIGQLRVHYQAKCLPKNTFKPHLPP